MDSRTPWENVRLPGFAKLRKHMACDVVIVGGEITGLTTAYILANAGKNVCLLERGRLGGGDSACTTAHLTMVTDARISQLADRFGREVGRLVWQAGLLAIDCWVSMAIRSMKRAPVKAR